MRLVRCRRCSNLYDRYVWDKCPECTRRDDMIGLYFIRQYIAPLEHRIDVHIPTQEEVSCGPQFYITGRRETFIIQ